MNVIWILFLALYLVLTHIIARYIGAKRRIGYGMSVFWSILFSPVIGLVVSLLSKPIKAS